jgi:hypothetical protein
METAKAQNWALEQEERIMKKRCYIYLFICLFMIDIHVFITLSVSHYMASNGGVSEKLERMLMEEVAAYLEVLPSYLFGATVDDHEGPQVNWCPSRDSSRTPL